MDRPTTWKCKLLGHKPPGYGYIGNLYIAPNAGEGSRVNVAAMCGREGCLHVVPMCVIHLPTQEQMDHGHNVPGVERLKAARGPDWKREGAPR